MFKNKNIRFLSFGEVLFDVFENEKRIGGAPLNIALRINSLGFPVAVISAVGDDNNGNLILDHLRQKKVNTSAIKVLQNYPTGKVIVSLDDNGVADYTIAQPVAWDFISLNKTAVSLAVASDVIIYGSLASRNEVSKASLLSMLAQSNAFKVFDVNLRPPHYTMETIQKLLQFSNMVKFNEEELLEISQVLGSVSDGIEQNIRFIKEKTGIQTICVTMGGAGAMLFYKDRLYSNPGYQIEVVDTVGAGDSFLGALLCSLLSDKEPQKALDFASAIGCYVTGSMGAIPEIDLNDIKTIMNSSKNKT
ncbi:fructokinase [Salegentibacter echinorum]|uniref:Fructokinase n=1 Tax=Salegentibacter echinorum TaxID=1073325 RepID=A0A1M5K0I4_SALEC|nr:carbohydrate kinase [Salegentibacter echinorum]SHG46326.1 fructokinase [Salegentibacter echinorum]